MSDHQFDWLLLNAAAVFVAFVIWERWRATGGKLWTGERKPPTKG